MRRQKKVKKRNKKKVIDRNSSKVIEGKKILRKIAPIYLDNYLENNWKQNK